jgi:hypothetical protein
MLAHLRAEAYPVYQRHRYPPALGDDGSSQLSYERNNALIDQAKLDLQKDLAAVKYPHQSEPDEHKSDRKGE